MRKGIKKQGLPFASLFFHICHIFVFCILHSSCNQCLRHMTYKPQTQISAIYCIFGKYECDMCVSYMYFKPFLGMWSSIRPPSPICGSITTLPILYFYIIFFLIFFIFIFFLSCLLPCVLILPSIYPLFFPTIARMSFCVQLVT